MCGAPHTCPPEGHTCPVPQVLGRDDVARSTSAVPGGAGVTKLKAVRRQEELLGLTGLGGNGRGGTTCRLRQMAALGGRR